MTIAILLPDLRGGGAERVSVDLARAFAGYGHRVEFVLMRAQGDFLSEVAREFEVIDLGTPRVRDLFRPLATYVGSRKPAAMIAMMWPLTALAPLVARATGSKVPMLVCEHGMLSRQYARRGIAHLTSLRASTALGYRLAKARIGVSRGVAEDMARLAGLPFAMVDTVYNPVRALALPDAASTAEAGSRWGSNGPRILSVGSFKDVKNHALLLHSFAPLAQHNRNARLMLLGQGEKEQGLRALAAGLGLADRVVFAGFHADPSPFYATADLFALASDHEGFGNVLVEALSFGLPVVSTDCPSGPAEILDNGRFGTLVPVGDAPTLARAIEAALRAPVDRTALKRRAGDFAPEIAARRYLELLGLA